MDPPLPLEGERGNVPAGISDNAGCKAWFNAHIERCMASAGRSIARRLSFSFTDRDDRNRCRASASQPDVARGIAPAPRRPAVDFGGGVCAAWQVRVLS